ncbi:hypothetical protein CLU79DRAFT_729064 [Phycomyces nitens]|nr:hypothetical protein CLU79DRAFT_729064 [Phycomyces nitens]
MSPTITKGKTGSIPKVTKVTKTTKTAKTTTTTDKPTETPIEIPTDKKENVKKIVKKTTEKPKPGPKKPEVAPKKRLTPAEALLKSMTARKAAKDALLKGSAPTLHMTFDDEGNESVVEPKKEEKKKVVETKKRKTESKEEVEAKKAKVDESLKEMQASVEEQKKKKPKKPKAPKAPKAPKEQKEESLGKKEESLVYLRLFCSDRSLWKFRKVQQIWLLQHIYDTDQINDDDFKLLVEYIKDLQGMARKNLLVEAQKICQTSTVSQALTGYVDTQNNDDDDDFDAEKLLARSTVQAEVEPSDEPEESKVERAKTIVRVLL